MLLVESELFPGSSHTRERRSISRSYRAAMFNMSFFFNLSPRNIPRKWKFFDYTDKSEALVKEHIKTSFLFSKVIL